jgi:flagellar basal-body rod protein FlgC
MDLFSVFDISAAGMSVEQSRLTVAAANLANSRTTKAADGTVYKPMSVSVRSTSMSSYAQVAQDVTAASLPRPEISGVVTSNVAPRLVLDPGHPDADKDGFVSMPATDPVTSALEILNISRSYEANLRAFDVTRNLIERTLEIGKQT